MAGSKHFVEVNNHRAHPIFVFVVAIVFGVVSVVVIVVNVTITTTTAKLPSVSYFFR
jgi:hypothetical protein